MKRYIARLALGAKCGSPRLLPASPAGESLPDAKARWRKLASPKRVASDAQPSTFPQRPRNWLRDSETDHSSLSASGMGRSIGVILSSQSLHSACCFIGAFYLLTVSSRFSISLATIVQAASSGSGIELSRLISPKFTRELASFGFPA